MTKIADNILQGIWRRLHVVKHNVRPKRFDSDKIMECSRRRPSIGGRVAIFNHFDRDGEVDPYVLFHLKYLSDIGFAIVFVTTSEAIQPQATKQLSELCWLALRRKNVGLDLGGWPCAMRKIRQVAGRDLSDYSQVVFANDSVFGPLKSLDASFASMAARGVDIWGITESLERLPHLQSYFVVFEKSGLEFLQHWLEKFLVVADREELIARYEVGLSAAARRAGLHIAAMIPADVLALHIDTGGDGNRDQLSQKNPMHVYWRETLQLGAPFIKRDLLMRGMQDGSDPLPWKDAIAENSPDYPVHLVEDYLSSRVKSPGQIF